MDKIGILWDLDGTIVDSLELYYQACFEVLKTFELKSRPCAIEKYRAEYFGRSPKLFFRDHLTDPYTDEEIDKYYWEYLQCSDRLLQDPEKNMITLIPGVTRVLDAFYAKGYPMALASTSWMPTAVHTLEKIGYLTRFTNISSGFLLPSKPAPDVFRIGAEMINLPPERCVVFEDSLAGMKGAKAAGMKCVGIASSVPVSRMVDADIRLERYDELQIDDVESLFG